MTRFMGLNQVLHQMVTNMFFCLRTVVLALLCSVCLAAINAVCQSFVGFLSYISILHDQPRFLSSSKCSELLSGDLYLLVALSWKG